MDTGSGRKEHAMNDVQRQYLERLTALLNDPHADHEALDQLYLELVSEPLAQLARSGYRREGRGAVVIGIYGVDMRRRHTDGLPVNYLAHAQLNRKGVRWPAPAIEHEIVSYDP
jgi:hypothetical protein